MKKTGLFVMLLIIVLGAGTTASFAACTATTLSAGSGTWGIEAYGQELSPTSQLDNILIQVTFASGGTFSGTEWQSLGGTLSSFAISGSWAMGTPVADCQGTITVTSPSTQTFHFSINTANKGGTLAQTDAGYTMAGFMVSQAATVVCSSSSLRNKQFSLYSNGTIPAVGGLVTGTGEIKFGTTGATFNAVPTVTLDLGAAGNFTLPANGTAAISSNCTGSGTLVVPALGQSFSVDFVVVGTGTTGNEVLWIVSNPGDNVTGYFLL